VSRGVALIAAGIVIAGVSLLAQKPQTPAAASTTLAIQQLGGEASDAQITVTSPSVTPNGPLPLVHSDYGERVSPALHWSGVPAEAKSIALIMEDPDAQEAKPFVHWMLYNLPATVTSIPESITGLPRLPELSGALQGRNSKGTIGYFGPRPPTSDPAHHYHFQIFAVSEMLPIQPSASREALLAALHGHVLAAGDLVVTFQAPLNAR
jgi:Raf kinase inhibitor-like YbhB/YbcL family protein